MSNRKNLANGILALGVSDTDTTWVLQNGYGAGMPDVPFYLTGTPFGQLSTSGNSEIVKVTARTSDTLTVQRGAKGTTARSFQAGDIVSNGVYVEDMPVSYSSSEQDSGIRWIDGKVVYQKTINFGVAPNNTNKSVAHGISNISEVIKYEGFTSTGPGNGNYMSLPFVESSNVAYSMSVRATNTHVTIKTNQDNTPFTNTYVTLFYTKTI